MRANSSGPTKKQSSRDSARLVQVFYRGQEEDDEALMAPSLIHLALCATAFLGLVSVELCILFRRMSSLPVAAC